MDRTQRTRRQLLAGAVRENLAEVRGELPAGLRKKPRRWLRVLAPLAAVSALVSFAAAAYVRTLVGGPEASPAAPELRVATLAAAAEARATAAAASERDAQTPPASFDAASLPLGVRRVVIDPGHGGRDIGTLARGQLNEKEVALDLARRTRTLLTAAGFDVLLTRDDDRKLSLQERADFANRARADAFVSIHLNWLPERQVRGVETYYLGPTDDPELTRLAAAENQDSGYALADLRKLLDRIYADVRRDESRRLASAVQVALHRSLRTDNPDLVDWGVKSAPFVVLVATEAPAILAEVSCLSHAEEVRLLASDAYRQRIAQALADGIQAFATAHRPPRGAEPDRRPLADLELPAAPAGTAASPAPTPSTTPTAPSGAAPTAPVGNGR
jgi:N-acetylmuramoyl-L-alanine amidase